MGSFSFAHWAIVLLIVLLVFGAGKLPRVMGDLAMGLKSFKAGMREDVLARADVSTVTKVADAPIEIC